MNIVSFLSKYIFNLPDMVFSICFKGYFNLDIFISASCCKAIVKYLNNICFCISYNIKKISKLSRCILKFNSKSCDSSIFIKSLVDYLLAARLNAPEGSATSLCFSIKVVKATMISSSVTEIYSSTFSLQIS